MVALSPKLRGVELPSALRPLTSLAAGVVMLGLFSFSTILLFLLLFPMFFVLPGLIEEDRTPGALDTAIMASIFLLIILILVAYG